MSQTQITLDELLSIIGAKEVQIAQLNKQLVNTQQQNEMLVGKVNELIKRLEETEHNG